MIKQFYDVLDKDTAQQLTVEQKQCVEDAVISVMKQSTEHIFLPRKTLVFFFSRHNYLCLFGIDLHHSSALYRLFVLLIGVIILLFLFFCVLLALYIIKSALGIDIFPHYHIGIWDWWLSLKNCS